MAKSAQKLRTRINLNLLYPQGRGFKWPIRFLKWLISYGRFIVVAVEVLVLTTFAMRFKLDNDLSNLKEQIPNQINYLESLSTDEALIQQTQLRFSFIKNSIPQSSSWNKTLAGIAKQLPIGIKLTTLNLDDPNSNGKLKIKLGAQANSNNDLGLLLNGLKSDQTLSEVALTNISFDQGQISFVITALVK